MAAALPPKGTTHRVITHIGDMNNYPDGVLKWHLVYLEHDESAVTAQLIFRSLAVIWINNMIEFQGNPFLICSIYDSGLYYVGFVKMDATAHLTYAYRTPLQTLITGSKQAIAKTDKVIILDESLSPLCFFIVADANPAVMDTMVITTIDV